MSQKTAPTEAEINDNVKELAWLALGFFQALLNGEAKVLIEHHPYHDRSLVSTNTRVSLEWNRPRPEADPAEAV